MAGPLGTEALASLRGYRSAYLMPDAVWIGRRTEGTDTGGGPDVTYPETATVGRITPARGVAREQIIGQRPAARSPVQGLLPYGTNLGADDRVRDGFGSIEVLGVDHGSWQTGETFLGIRLD